MTPGGRQSWRSSPGAALVELVVVTPLLILMVLGAADFGRVFYTSIVLRNAARAGAAYAVADAANMVNTTGIRDAALAEATDVGAISVSSSSVCECLGGSAIACNDANGCSGGYGVPQAHIAVTTAWNFTPIVPYPFIPDRVSMNYTARVRLH